MLSSYLYFCLKRPGDPEDCNYCTIVAFTGTVNCECYSFSCLYCFIYCCCYCGSFVAGEICPACGFFHKGCFHTGYQHGYLFGDCSTYMHNGQHSCTHFSGHTQAGEIGRTKRILRKPFVWYYCYTTIFLYLFYSYPCQPGAGQFP